MKFGNICPVCPRKLTKGVEQRVEELADRPADFEPAGIVGFMHLLALHEIIMTVLGVESPATQKVWGINTPLIEKFGDEYTVLTEVPREALASVAGEAVADAIVRVTEGHARVVPGYDGVYGKLVLSDEIDKIGKIRRGKRPTDEPCRLHLTSFSPYSSARCCWRTRFRKPDEILSAEGVKSPVLSVSSLLHSRFFCCRFDNSYIRSARV